MHRVKFIQVTDGELLEALLRFLFDEGLEVLLGVLSLLDLSLQDFLELVNFFKRF